MSKTIALISGANQGIGLAAATRIAREFGYQVIIGSRNAENGAKEAAKLRTEGLAVDSVQLDLASDESIERAADYISSKYGKLDVLVNNAGILIDVGVAKANPELPTRELFEKTFSTNVTGTACLTEAMIPLLRKSDQRPRLVFVSSIMGSITESLDQTTAWYEGEYRAYDASKAAANMLAVNYNRILRDVRARVNVACPGLVATNLTKYTAYGSTPEDGARRIVQLATLAEDDETTGTFSNVHGGIAW
jgi:NAD(P)-dependent dehydrogenase (short-subunit alcohol dehydrogenase family)